MSPPAFAVTLPEAATMAPSELMSPLALMLTLPSASMVVTWARPSRVELVVFSSFQPTETLALPCWVPAEA